MPTKARPKAKKKNSLFAQKLNFRSPVAVAIIVLAVAAGSYYVYKSFAAGQFGPNSLLVEAQSHKPALGAQGDTRYWGMNSDGSGLTEFKQTDGSLLYMNGATPSKYFTKLIGTTYDGKVRIYNVSGPTAGRVTDLPLNIASLTYPNPAGSAPVQHFSVVGNTADASTAGPAAAPTTAAPLEVQADSTIPIGTTWQFAREVSFSPNGAHIVYNRYTYQKASDTKTVLVSTQLFTANSDGTNIKAITPASTGTDFYFDVRWQPMSGNLVSYSLAHNFKVATNAYQQTTTFHTVKSDGRQDVNLGVRGVGNLTWLPNGSKLILQLEYAGRHLAVRANPDGTGAQALGSPNNDLSDAGNLVISPDGKYAAGWKWTVTGGVSNYALKKFNLAAPDSPTQLVTGVSCGTATNWLKNGPIAYSDCLRDPVPTNTPKNYVIHTIQSGVNRIIFQPWGTIYGPVVKLPIN